MGNGTGEHEDRIRSADEIAKRALILHSLVTVAHGADRESVLAWLKEQRLWEDVSRIERALFEWPNATERQLINATWRVEALEAIVWSMGLVPELSPSQDQCDTKRLKQVFSFFLSETTPYLESASLRPEEEIVECLDRLHDEHWKIRDARINKRQIPDGLNEGVVREKHYALNWVTGYCGLEWDDVTTDT